MAAKAHARVTRIVVDDVKPLTAAVGQTIVYEQISGRAFGELDPRAPGNALIQDIELGKDADGKARYEAGFVLTKPVNMNQASGLIWHDVPTTAAHPSPPAWPAPGRVATRPSTPPMAPPYAPPCWWADATF